MSDSRSLLAEIAVPRRTGTLAHARVREALRRELIARGLVVMEQPFRGRCSPWLRGVGSPSVEGVNLIAVRSRARVAVWLVAHYDSKGQPLSMLGRLATFPLSLLLNQVDDRSPGAVDNATGLLTVLSVLDRLPPDAPVGVIFPDAEELGLVGARALARERANLLAETVVINFDGIDDGGRTVAYVHRGGPTTTALVRALGATSRTWLPVIVDGNALKSSGRECITIMRGDWRTMRVVHTVRDNAARLTRAGVEIVAAGVASGLLSAQFEVRSAK